MCSGSEAGSYLRCIVFVFHSTLGFRVIRKKNKSTPLHPRLGGDVNDDTNPIEIVI